MPKDTPSYFEGRSHGERRSRLTLAAAILAGVALLATCVAVVNSKAREAISHMLNLDGVEQIVDAPRTIGSVAVMHTAMSSSIEAASE